MTRQAGDEGQRHEHCDQHEGDGDNRAGNFAHGLIGGLTRCFARFDIAFDVFDHHDGVIDNDADGQHQTEQGQCVDGEAEDVHDREGADDGNRYAQQRYDRRPPGLQEQDHHQDDEQNGL